MYLKFNLKICRDWASRQWEGLSDAQTREQLYNIFCMKSEALGGADKATLDELMTKACLRYPTLRTWSGLKLKSTMHKADSAASTTKQRGAPAYSKSAFLKVRLV
jgi:hypothetical protein